MTTSNGRFAVAYNGEIFNFREIRAELETKGYAFRSASDTEVLLAAWEEWGVGALSRFRGFFAFALFDRRNGELVLARDRLGIKPLYYCVRNGVIAFASEIRALIASGFAEREIDRAGLDSYLTFGSTSEPHTIIAGVRMLRPATWLRWSPRTLESGVFWHLPAPGAQQNVQIADVVAQLRQILRESVKLRLLADVPVGVFLSGGLDSSVITAFAARESSRSVRTFTVSFVERAYDEARFARMVADRLGCEHQIVSLDPDHAAAEIDDAVASLDQPSADGINTWFVAKATRNAGISVALSGLGGDELFGGYQNFGHISRILWLGKRAPTRPFAIADRFVGDHFRFRVPNSVAKSLATIAEGRGLVGAYSVLRAFFTPGQRLSLFGKSEPAAAFIQAPWSQFSSYASAQPRTAYSALEICNYMRNTLLRDTDVMSMAHALEVRVPLLDHHVVELVMSLPDSCKVARGMNKPLLARLVPELPVEAVRRRKMGFTLPFDSWFRGPLRAWMEERLFSRHLVRSGLSDEKAIRRLWSGYLRGERYVSHARVWSLAVLAQWCETNRMSLDAVRSAEAA